MADFSWAAAADVGTGLMGGLSAGLDALGKAAVTKANAKSADLLRDGRNEVARSQQKLAGVVRGINNNRLLEASKGQLDSLTETAARTGDAFTSGRFEQSIQAAEQWGHAAASASAQGLGGAGIRAIGLTNSLNIARKQHALEERGDIALNDAANAGVGTMARTLQSLQMGPIPLRQDFSASAVQPGPNLGMYLLNGVLSKKDSLQTMLGSLYTQPSNTAATPESAVTSPVERGNVVGTPLSNFKFEVGPYEDTQRLLNRSTTQN